MLVWKTGSSILFTTLRMKRQGVILDVQTENIRNLWSS